ncbi:tRNA (guanosine(46)-N7)-methyltransferase TrmB [Pleionea litopenaei]|uniref:tRNA (guanine-N(7)-)-methyltransferase n=1 Tax=Pleionea litopenaei TaxID=3070815 RepID=A0AA51X5K6_9GAMM|nr:tRNA (guanosine(46)-N7)-methyltransferase TrmB [Pleionea sp. HL-JVS1]WMS85899.1 tRNA (guanosine(46)-N7)-methyltransferase TrmB [Pleionea sp. HL-JVS1]
MTDSEKAPFMRQIRSFVLREGRMTKGQERAMTELFPTLGIEYSDEMMNFAQIFGNDRPVVLEIGFGMGKSLALQAQQNPDRNYIGIEVHRPGVGACLLLAEEYELTNLRVINHDAVEVLNHMVGQKSLAGMQVYFPDPWHKKKHHKRRIIQPAFVDTCHSKIASGGFLHLATDWENYAEHMLEVMQQVAGWRNTSATNDYIPRPDSRPITKFETRGTKLGHGVWDLMFVRED